MHAIRAEALSRSFRVLRGRDEAGRRVGGLWSRAYARVDAVTAVSFAIDEGQIVGYLGPNGAGKSTTIKMLTGVLRPSAGSVEVLGLDPFRQRQRLCAEIGVLFGQRSQLWWDIPLVESFVALRYIYALGAEDFRRQLDLLRDLLQLDPFLQTPVRQLSLGQRMRGELAAILLHRPRMLFLDEPTIGVDAVAKAALRRFLLDLNRIEGVTILLTSHDLGDIESVCRRVLLLHDGRLIGDGPPDEVARRFGVRPALVLYFPPDRPQRAEDLRLLLPAGCAVDARPDGTLAVAFDRTALTPPQILARLADVPILDFRLEEASLADAFLKVYGGAAG
jgi:ABC-2 type transport system ATP-binding protein